MTSQDYAGMFEPFTGTPGDLIPLLQCVQAADGYISEEATARVARFLRVSENVVFGVASFYSQFRFQAPGRHSVKVCLGTACHVRGGEILSRMLERDLGISAGETTPDRRYDLQRVACLGCCALAPVIQVDSDIYSQVTVIRLHEILEAYA
ncbi:MAG TPA: NAD(P)H-dependent oxidoreductase subunit E [Acidobacteriota bacterium]|nr:NAD(P)H-dependent oxidoreductase subunit E [Acidobacteriota bacterium]